MLTLVRRIGTEFGIPVPITRTCSASSSTSATTSSYWTAAGCSAGVQGSPDWRDRVLAVEVRDLSGRDRLGVALDRAGARARADGPLVLVEITGDETYDLVRDTVASSGSAWSGSRAPAPTWKKCSVSDRGVIHDIGYRH